MTSNYTIIVGGGNGTRMGSEIPKQFIVLNGLPILMHTLYAFARSKTKQTLILVLNTSLIEQWSKLCKQYAFEVPHIVVSGGSTRFHSVYNGLDYIKQHLIPNGEGFVAIHDGVRPLISQEIIVSGFNKITNHPGGLVTAIPSKDSVRMLAVGATKALDRSTIFLVQTPQFFPFKTAYKAYQQPYKDQFTDDASVVESAGYPIEIIQGDTQNIKITFPADLQLAEILMKNA